MSKTIHLLTIGKLTQNENFDDWWNSQPVPIPLFENKELDIIFMDYVPDHDNNFLDEADEALKNFLGLGLDYKKHISKYVFSNCMDFLNAVEYDEADEDLWKIEDPDDIWQYVYPSEIYVTRRSRRDENIYIMVACGCEWEQEHGLQLVFRQGKKLTRVSDQDGHVTEADAYDKPDCEDELLSRF